MPVVDAHQHFWRHGERAHAWPAAATAALSRDFTPAELRAAMGEAEVDGTILVQSLNDAEETEAFLDLAGETTWILGVVGWAALDEPRRLADRLAALRRRSHKLIGLRHLVNFEPDPRWLLRPEVREGLDVLAASGLAFEVVPTDPARFEAALEAAASRPAMPVVIDHLARPPAEATGWQPWAALIERAAALPNTRIKLSVGLDLALGWRWSPDALRPYVEHVLRCFGPRRVLAASNWPVSLLAGGYASLWAGYRALLAHLPPAERDAVLGGNALDLIRALEPA
jgi:L-fuconolactonase